MSIPTGRSEDSTVGSIRESLLSGVFGIDCFERFERRVFEDAGFQWQWVDCYGCVRRGSYVGGLIRVWRECEGENCMMGWLGGASMNFDIGKAKFGGNKVGVWKGIWRPVEAERRKGHQAHDRGRVITWLDVGLSTVQLFKRSAWISLDEDHCVSAFIAGGNLNMAMLGSDTKCHNHAFWNVRSFFAILKSIDVLTCVQLSILVYDGSTHTTWKLKDINLTFHQRLLWRSRSGDILTPEESIAFGTATRIGSYLVRSLIVTFEDFG